MNRTMLMIGLVVVLFAAIVFGVVTVASNTSTDSNTKNAVTPGPPLPPGVSAPARSQ